MLTRDEQGVARKQRPAVEERDGDLVLEDDRVRLLAGDDAAERTALVHAAEVTRGSGDDGERLGLDPQLDLGEVADVVAVDLEREWPGPASLVHAAEVTRGSGDDGERLGLDPQLDLGEVADVVAVDLERELFVYSSLVH